MEDYLPLLMMSNMFGGGGGANSSSSGSHNSFQNNNMYLIFLTLIFKHTKFFLDIMIVAFKYIQNKIKNYNYEYYEYNVTSKKIYSEQHGNYSYQGLNYLIHESIDYFLTVNRFTIKKSSIKLKNFTSKEFNFSYSQSINDWIKINNDIEIIYIEEKEKDINKDTKDKKTDKYEISNISTVTFVIRSKNHSKIYEFIHDTINNYHKHLFPIDTKLFYYSYNGLSKDGYPEVNKYLLNNSKTFESLFFNEKIPFLSVLDNFINKTGAYKFSGIQHRLGLLLHGPPGTGKTSLIKAMSNKLKRNIVNIDLSKIKTNTELFKIIYDKKYLIENNFIDFNYKDVIFVIEDIDCIKNIVKKRDDKDSDNTDGTDNIADILNFIVQNTDTDTDNETKKSNSGSRIGCKTGSKSELGKLSDKLNLAGILNIIDGVIDCPDRIMLFTTNHHNQLDPALIRPGRIDYDLNLSYLNKHCLIEILKF
jgi:hypothetical protein